MEVQHFHPANANVERQLEQQMEAERNRRKQLLDTQAAINVAEGMKQRTILNSEVRSVGCMGGENDGDADIPLFFCRGSYRQRSMR